LVGHESKCGITFDLGEGKCIKSYNRGAAARGRATLKKVLKGKIFWGDNPEEKKRSSGSELGGNQEKGMGTHR